MDAHPYRRVPDASETGAAGSRRLLAAEWVFAAAFWLTSAACAASAWFGGKLGAEGTIALIVTFGSPIVFWRLWKARPGH